MQLTSDIKEKGGACILSNSIAALKEQVIKRDWRICSLISKHSPCSASIRPPSTPSRRERKRKTTTKRQPAWSTPSVFFSWWAQTLTGKCMKMKEKDQDQAVPRLVRSIWFFSGWAQTLTLKKYEYETLSMDLELHWRYIEESLILPQSPGQIQKIPN